MEAQAPIDVDRLTGVLEVLANANRLELLQQLREPRAASEILLRPGEIRDGENPERAISKQAVRNHLARLLEIGVVAVRKGSRSTGPVDEFVVNQQRLFTLAEEFRKLGTLAPVQPFDDRTIEGPLRGRPVKNAGAHLVLVHGLDEGKVFPLGEADATPSRGWILGRRRGVAVSLEYDPFVSAENAEIRYERSGYRISDLAGSRNGTRVNWEPIPKGQARELRTGDVIGLGHSLLLFRTQ